MSETAHSDSNQTNRITLSKVPEVTVWFWIIKILCTTVGESFADWINMGLGVGLNATALIFTVSLAVILAAQLRLDRYVPFVYWLTVVVLSVAGTLYTDILTDSLGVPLALSTSVFALTLVVVFGIWFARERTLSIHSIVTLPRESFYWLAVLVTFALGTAVGDWTLELTGWGPGTSVLLPAGLIAAILVGWRFGANPVLAFWLAYVLTRPLGANLGDWLASAPTERGLGLGYGITSVIFLVTILTAVAYLSFSRTDVIGRPDDAHRVVAGTKAGREYAMLGYFSVVAVAAAVLLGWAAAQPRTTSVVSEEESGSHPMTETLAPGQAAATFPSADVATFRTLARDTLAKVDAGDQSAASSRVTDLEKAWDDGQATLQPLDEPTWTVLDGQLDAVLTAVRASTPDPATERETLKSLLASLR